MNMNYKYLCTFLLLCAFTSTSLFAQKDEVTNAMLLITYKKAADSNQREQINLRGEEAYQFDVADFLSKNRNKDIIVNGGGTVNNERLTWHFRSKDLKENVVGNTFRKVITAVDKSPFLGVGVVAMDDFSGARITNVIEGSSAEQYGFQIGDIITLIDDYEIYTPCDLTKAISKSTPGDLLEVDIVRGDENQTIEPTLGYRLHKKLSWKPSELQPVVVENVTTKNTWNADLTIYPNPTDGVTQVKYTATEKGNVVMNLTDLTGRIIQTKKLTDFDGFYNDILDLTSQPDGVYFLNVIQGEEVKTEKIVLQKK